MFEDDLDNEPDTCLDNRFSTCLESELDTGPCLEAGSDYRPENSLHNQLKGDTYDEELRKEELNDIYSGVVIDLVKAQATLTETTATCQSAINRIDITLKEAADIYTRTAKDFDTNIQKSMLDVVNKGSAELMENLARNYKELHFQVEKWNRSGALGGLYSLKYGVFVLISFQLFNLVLLGFLIYRLK